MERLKRMSRTSMLVGMLLIGAMFVVGCAGTFGTWDEEWYAENPMTRAEVLDNWGPPDQVISFDDGTEELIYKRLISDSQSTFGYLIKDDMVVKQYWK